MLLITPHFVSGGEISNDNVLSSHIVNSMDVCGQLCHGVPSCTGFNYNTAGNQNEVNCQVTDIPHEDISVISQAPIWDFYQFVQVYI